MVQGILEDDPKWPVLCPAALNPDEHVLKNRYAKSNGG
jgi:hypothetical protein